MPVFTRRKNSPSNELSPNQTYRRNDVSEIHHRFHCRGCNRLCCVRAPALIDFKNSLANAQERSRDPVLSPFRAGFSFWCPKKTRLP